MGEPQAQHVDLLFVDVLYGLAAAACFASAFDGAPLTATGWSHFGVAMTVITLSWVGYHLHRFRESARRPPGVPDYFRGWCRPLWLLVADIYLLALYYVLAVDVTPRPAMQPELRLLFMIFVGYLMWDLLALETVTRRVAVRWMLVDLAFIAVFGLGWAAFGHVAPADTGVIVAVDAVTIALLLAYRIVEERFSRVSTATTPDVPWT